MVRTQWATGTRLRGRSGSLTLFLLRAHAKAHGVTGRAIAAYLLVWLGIAVTARYRLSTFGLNVAPAGSSPLDTVAILTTLIPAAVISRCLRSRLGHLEATRSRSRQPTQTLWLATVCALAAGSPLLVTPVLQAQINKAAFLAAWTIVLGTYLLAAVATPAPAAFAATLTVVIVFSSPGLVAWEHNILYNVHLSGLTAAIGAVLLTTAVLTNTLASRTAPLAGHDQPH